VQAHPKARFSAKLLFQFKVCYAKGGCNKRRLCEERIISYEAEDARAALAHAKKYGKSAQYDYKNGRNDTVRVELVGLQDLLKLGLEAGPDEVWYDIIERLLPDERRSKFIPTDKKLIQRASK
jgi:hypothetical protein